MLKILYLFLYAIFKVHQDASYKRCIILIDPSLKKNPIGLDELPHLTKEYIHLSAGLKWTRTTDLTLIRRAL